MAVPSLSFLVGLLVTLYLSTFVIFAIVRIITGVSIQRLGLRGLRRIAYVPRSGLKIEIRGLGFSIHRPTYSQPTWVSFVVEELKVTLDLESPGSGPPPHSSRYPKSEYTSHFAKDDLDTLRSSDKTEEDERTKTSDAAQAKAWKRLIDIKNMLKKLHRIIPWLRLLDVVASKSSIAVKDVGTIQIGTLMLSVDTRRHAIDRSRFFQHTRVDSDEQQPAEWTIGIRSVLFTPENKDSIEILDHCVVNIHGFLYEKVEGLRDVSVFVKLGRLHVPYDDIVDNLLLVRKRTQLESQHNTSNRETVNTVQNNDASASSSDVAVQYATAQAKDFVRSTLRGIREVSFAVSFVGISKRIDSIRPAGSPIYLSMSLKELGLDIDRLDPTTPAHAMYFSRRDIAHQALLSAISLSVGVDDGLVHPERLLYIPMTTATVKTTLPSKLLQFAAHEGTIVRNNNVFFANLVITSPSIDLDPHHLPLVLAFVDSRRAQAPQSTQKGSFHFVSQLLPRASIKLSIQEPVVRVALPSVEAHGADDFNFDLLISAVSSVSLDLDSSHSGDDESSYHLSSNLRLVSHRFYYQTVSKVRHDLLHIDTMELRTQLAAAPDVKVAASATVRTLSMFMVRPEITNGIKQIMQQLRLDAISDKTKRSESSPNPNIMRNLPFWLHHFQLDATDFNVEIAGIDKKLSKQSRGCAGHLEGWTVEYRARKDETPSSPSLRRRGLSKPADEPYDLSHALSSASSRRLPETTNGRRITLHVRNFEAFIIECSGTLEQRPFAAIPRAEIAFTTSNDGHSPVLHINSLVKALHLQYSLFRHYCLGVALVMLQHTFVRPDKENGTRNTQRGSATTSSEDQSSQSVSKTQHEMVVIDFKANFVQLKASLPSDPALMLHFQDLEIARHRYMNPYARADVVRLYAEAPLLKKAWARVVSIKTPRVDLREGKRKHQGSTPLSQKSIDFACEAVRIGVPHQLVVYKIFDNLVNTAKTVTQLHHRFATGSDDYVLAKRPEGAKSLPRITIRTHFLLFELEDSAFEWKLGVIYRTGLVEQKQRFAREEAFRLKVRRIEGEAEPSASARSRSRVQKSSSKVRGRSRSTRTAVADEGVNADDERGRSASRSPFSKPSPGIRYDAGKVPKLSSAAQTSINEAEERLQRYNSQSWKKRIDRSLRTYEGQMTEFRSFMWGLDSLAEDSQSEETILQLPRRPALMCTIISDLNVTIDRPSFSSEQLKDFMYDVGKGLPRDTQFSLLVPLNAKFEMGECRVKLRDYPLPLLHIPAIKPGQSPRLPSWSLQTDFVIAEEFRGFESTRDFKIPVVPANKLNPGTDSVAFAIDVRRTVSPVKTYSNIKIEINTARDTRFTWGSSYQPAIQEFMQVVESFSKPQVDPSDRVGFWDKIRLSFHSKVNVAWTGNGDVHMMLKGSRDPYLVTGQGAGFVMIWRNDVQWNIWQENDPRKFTTVDSGDYVLAIPDFSHYARQSQDYTGSRKPYRNSSVSSQSDGVIMKKVVMKLSGAVRWSLGMVFERNLPNGSRSFDFGKHYDVTLKNPQHVKSIKNEEYYDAFRGFRSNYIHMSIGIIAPNDRNWASPEDPHGSGYNAVHLTPRFFTHFFAWWSMFSGVMSLPVHQGPLFPGVEKSGKKFGRHLATIKYSLLLSPLFISHVYKHKDAEDFSSGDDTVSATGLKLRLDSFMLDLHQRREEFNSDVKGLHRAVKTSGMRINQTLLDLKSADLRAVSASITGTTVEAVNNADSAKLADLQDTLHRVNLASFTIPDNDFTWIDVDDFVEIDWSLPSDSDPATKILPLAFAPRFTYRRQTDHHDNISGDPDRSSPFGDEATHYCFMATQSDSRHVQLELIQARLDKLEQVTGEHARTLGEHELRCIRETEGQSKLQSRLQELQEHTRVLEKRKSYLNKLLQDLRLRIEHNDWRAVAEADEVNKHRAGISQLDDDEEGPSLEDRDTMTLADHLSDFNNRFVVHNSQIKWNNSLRNIMLRYIHQVNQRRGFVYYTSRRAVKFILDIIEEQRNKDTSAKTARAHKQTEQPQSPMTPEDSEGEVQDRINQLLDDGKRFVNADDPADAEGTSKAHVTEKADQNVGHEFTPQNTYHVRLVAPQIQMQSEKNTKAVILVTARGMRLKVISIMDRDRMSDEISGLVQRRFSLEMDNVQFFVTHKQTFSSEFLHFYAGTNYGSSPSSLWPPWAPIEVVFDLEVVTDAFTRVVQRTSAGARYDQYNKLRLKYNDNVSDRDSEEAQKDDQEMRMDHLWIDFPQLRAICDSSQYFAMYVIVIDLLMWSEPLEKTRNERLEKIMLASDFSDLRGTPEMVIMLQERIRQLEEIKTHFHVNEKYLDKQGWQDRITMEQDLTGCEDELFFIMKAITTSQRKTDDRVEDSQVNGLLKLYFSASEVVWHLTQGPDQSLVEFQLGQASFERTDNSDGSNHNVMDIKRIQGINMLPNTIFPDIISPYLEASRKTLDQAEINMLHVNWHMLEAIAGIPVVDHFEVNLFPLRVQLEYETGKRIFDYVFPARGAGEDGASPFMTKQTLPQTDEEQEEDEEQEAQESQEAANRASVSHAFGPGAAGTATGAGSLEYRLQATHKLPDAKRPSPTTRPHVGKPKHSGLGIHSFEIHGRKFFSHANTSQPASAAPVDGRSSSERTQGRTPSKQRSTPDLTVTSENGKVETKKRARFAKSQRSPSVESRISRRSSSRTSSKDNPKRHDDLTQMLNRASNYMTLSYVKLPSVVLCLSYKGRGNRNFEDVYDLVFRMPTLEYRNKTWSNLDLALALKKDVIRALIHHTGTILGNKFHHHKPGRVATTRLREIAESNVIMSNFSSSVEVSRIPSTASSVHGVQSSTDVSSPDGFRSPSPRISDITDDLAGPAANGHRSSVRPSTSATASYASSLMGPSKTPSDGYDGTSSDQAEPSIPAEIRHPESSNLAHPNAIRTSITRHFTNKPWRRESTPEHGNEGEEHEPNGSGGTMRRGTTLKRIFDKLPHN
ncbi:MAG: hypothetical protein M1828_000198 [Chrysothrix sp. TS-e1954]|nr:MAG: hypothetical protein M1828_000198 [Chrysothrix sp. TS-e1954]